MCGIVAYIGSKEAYPIIIDGLRRLEYRGYDSAGVAFLNGGLISYKKKGKVNDLEDFIGEELPVASIGIGHTRWATHGKPNDINAHPQISKSGDLAIVHNGIIENNKVLKTALQDLGYEFKSDTDTEVIVHLIEEYKRADNSSLEDAVRKALSKLQGAYAIVVLDKNEPDRLVAARKGSPLVVGIGKDEFLLASDATPIVGHTNQVIYLKDEEVVVVKSDGSYRISNIENKEQEAIVKEIDLKLEELEKGNFDHFMLKEIHQQPDTIKDAMRGRMSALDGWIKLGGVDEFETLITKSNRFIIVACGTSWHAALIGEYLFEELARIPVEVEYASEFRYRNPILNENDLVIALSQSGETADTLSALKLAKERGSMIYGIVNVVGSSIARMTDAGSYIHAGPEIGVASTKAFTGQVTILTMMAMAIGKKKGVLSETKFRNLLTELENIPQKIEAILQQKNKIEEIAYHIKDFRNALYLGRGYNFPIALEGALKLKEISYIHAEGYAAAEMKHGPIALIDEDMPVIVIATNGRGYDKIVSNVQEVKARKGKVISIVTQGDVEIKEISDYTIEIPQTMDPLVPLLSVIPLQLLSYYVAVMRDCNVDQPRNLAKSVTVE